MCAAIPIFIGNERGGHPAGGPVEPHRRREVSVGKVQVGGFAERE